MAPLKAMLQTYGLVAGKYDPRTYPRRTEQNVKDADGTIIFGDCSEGGTALTLRLCTKHHKPLIIIEQSGTLVVQVTRLIVWLADYDIQVLNVAGNRESKSPGIQKFVKAFLVCTLKCVQRQRQLTKE